MRNCSCTVSCTAYDMASNGFTCRAVRRDRVAEPVAGYGPAAGTGEENISVIVAPIDSGFRLSSLGSASQAAERFLKSLLGPGKSLQTELINPSQR